MRSNCSRANQPALCREVNKLSQGALEPPTTHSGMQGLRGGRGTTTPPPSPCMPLCVGGGSSAPWDNLLTSRHKAGWLGCIPMGLWGVYSCNLYVMASGQMCAVPSGRSHAVVHILYTLGMFPVQPPGRETRGDYFFRF